LHGDWGLGIGDWGFGDWGLGPIPNPQSPIPNPQSPNMLNYFDNFKYNLNKALLLENKIIFLKII
jgi:hypothetical protein